MAFSRCFWPSYDDEWYLDEVIPYFWDTDIDDHYFGKFSIAVLQGSNVTLDRSQVKVEDGAVFFGVYDGHGCNRASTYVVDNLYNNFRGHVQRGGMISGDTILNAIVDTENGFLDTVQGEFEANRNIAASGSCCLVGILAGGMLHYANLGDSRAVLGSVDFFKNIWTEQLTQDHDINDKKVRQEYKALHPGNDGLLVEVNGVWSINRIRKVTRCIGDGVFKRDNLAIQGGEFDVPRENQRPLLCAIPSLQERKLRPADRFVIFATNGLWELLTNWEAARVVHKGPRRGAAKRLIVRALMKRAERRGMTYDALKEVDIRTRHIYIDDISVIVLFIDHHLLENPRNMSVISVRGRADEAGSSDSDIEEGN